jgi:DnaJ-class molecular chaperone
MSAEASVSRLRTPTKYAQEVCTCCAKTGYSSGGLCPACNGDGTVLVQQPPTKCSQCRGRGMNAAGYYAQLCTLCWGTGWNLKRGR